MLEAQPKPLRPRVLIVSFTDLARDARLDRQIGFLREHYEVITAGLGRSAYPELEFVDLTPDMPQLGLLTRHGRRLRSIVERLSRRYHSAHWSNPVNAQALGRLSGHGADVTIANDVSALPVACETARGRPVILDAHEYSPAEQSELLWWRLTMRRYVDGLLRLYLPDVTAMMTVSPGIAELYRAAYGAQPVIVTNAPGGAPLSPTPTEMPIRLIHHGLADPQRELERMIEAMDMIGEGFTLDLMLVPGDRDYVARLRRMAAERRGVRVIEPCTPREIVGRLNTYDVGAYLMPQRSLNQRLALPNKLFDFIQARLALAIGPSPEMSDLVSSWGCGVVAERESVEAFASAVSGLTPERVMELKWASHRAARELTAERNRAIVLELVDGALKVPVAPSRRHPPPGSSCVSGTAAVRPRGESAKTN